MGIEEALEAVFFALVEDLDEVFKELHVVLATVDKKGERIIGDMVSRKVTCVAPDVDYGPYGMATMTHTGRAHLSLCVTPFFFSLSFLFFRTLFPLKGTLDHTTKHRPTNNIQISTYPFFHANNNEME